MPTVNEGGNVIAEAIVEQNQGFTATPGVLTAQPGNVIPGWHGDFFNINPNPPGALTDIPGIGWAMPGNILPGMGATRGQWKFAVAETLAAISDTVARSGGFHRQPSETLPAAVDVVTTSRASDTNSTTAKPYWLALYDNNLNFKKSIGNILNKPTLHCTINGGWDQITIEMPSNDLSSTAPARGDIIKLYEQGASSNNAIYQGIVEDIPDTMDVSPSHQLLVSGMVVELGDTLYNKDWSAAGADVATIVKDIVAQTKHLQTNAYTVPLTGVVGQYNFQNVSCVDALTECIKMAGPNYYWFADQTYVWFVNTNFTATPVYTIAQGVDYSKRTYTAPISDLKNYVVAVGGVPAGASSPIQAVYDQSAGSNVGKKALIPPISYPSLLDQATLNNMVNTVGSQLNRQRRSVTLTIPAFGKRFNLANASGATLRFFEPTSQPLNESFTGSGAVSATHVITDIQYDGPNQVITISDMPVTIGDFEYMLDQMAARVSNAAPQNVSVGGFGTITPSMISTSTPGQIT